jgi:serpin B
MRYIKQAVMVVLMLGVAACKAPVAAPSKVAEPLKVPESSKVPVATTASAPTDTAVFAVDLYQQLAVNTQGNLFFSPTSINMALAMTYAGTKGNTAQQMANTLHYRGTTEQVHSAFGNLLKILNDPPEAFNFVDQNGNAVKDLDATGQPIKRPAYELVIANALWGQKGYPFQPAFTELVQKTYGAGLNSVDYRQPEIASLAINDWVGKQTEDKIKDVIAPGVLTPATRLVLTNAIYFKSRWEEEFSSSATKDGPFRLSADKSVPVPLMYMQHGFAYMEDTDLQMLEMPYKHRDLSMVVLLPKKVDGLAKLEQNLTAANLRARFKETKRAVVDVTLPKFTINTQVRLSDTLKTMGMTDAFDATKADFSAMTSAHRLFLSAVVHQAFVAVDEKGTEATAATAIYFLGLVDYGQIKPKTFTADHPFVFLIRHNATGEILFLGRVTNPKVE